MVYNFSWELWRPFFNVTGNVTDKAFSILERMLFWISWLFKHLKQGFTELIFAPRLFSFWTNGVHFFCWNAGGLLILFAEKFSLNCNDLTPWAADSSESGMSVTVCSVNVLESNNFCYILSSWMLKTSWSLSPPKLQNSESLCKSFKNSEILSGFPSQLFKLKSFYNFTRSRCKISFHCSEKNIICYLL